MRDMLLAAYLTCLTLTLTLAVTPSTALHLAPDLRPIGHPPTTSTPATAAEAIKLSDITTGLR